MKKIFNPIHPGEILLKEFLIPFGISQADFANSINVPINIIKEICEEEINLTKEIAHKISKYFGMSEEFWINSLNNYEREIN